MSRVKQGFSGLTVLEQIERSRKITGLMTGNPNYVTPNPSIPTVTAATDACEVSYNASRSGDKVMAAQMRLDRKMMLFLISQLAAYVQEASDGDEMKILSSGFDIVKFGTKGPVVAGEVTNLRLSDGSTSGKVKVDWEKAVNAVIYVIMASPNADFSNAVQKGITTKTQKEISGLTPGTKYWVRIVPLGREEVGPESEPMSIIAR